MVTQMKDSIDPNRLDVLVYDADMGSALLQKAFEIMGHKPPAVLGGNLYTDDNGNTYAESGDLFSRLPEVSAIVDAGNYLKHGAIIRQQDLFKRSGHG